MGLHAACCGPNIYKIVKGSGTVYVNGKPQARLGDKTQHCGGSGKIIKGSSNVFCDDGALAALAEAIKRAAQEAFKKLTEKEPPKPEEKKAAGEAGGKKGGAGGAAGGKGAGRDVAQDKEPEKAGKISKAGWSLQECAAGDEINLVIETANLDGALDVKIYVRGQNPDDPADKPVATLSPSAGAKVEEKWKVDLSRAPVPAGAETTQVFYVVEHKGKGVKSTSANLTVDLPAFRFSD
jgi:hypothetical protein